MSALFKQSPGNMLREFWLFFILTFLPSSPGSSQASLVMYLFTHLRAFIVNNDLEWSHLSFTVVFKEDLFNRVLLTTLPPFVRTGDSRVDRWRATYRYVVTL